MSIPHRLSTHYSITYESILSSLYYKDIAKITHVLDILVAPIAPSIAYYKTFLASLRDYLQCIIILGNKNSVLRESLIPYI